MTVQLLNYGAMGSVLLYFIYKDNKTMVKLTETLQGFQEVLIVLKEEIQTRN